MAKEKDPNLIADDDHLDRKDISEKEFKDGLIELQKKFGKKTTKEKSKFSQGVIDSLNSIP